MNVFSLSWAAAGLALLGLSLFPAGSLALGGAPAHLAPLWREPTSVR